MDPDPNPRNLVEIGCPDKADGLRWKFTGELIGCAGREIADDTDHYVLFFAMSLPTSGRSSCLMKALPYITVSSYLILSLSLCISSRNCWKRSMWISGTSFIYSR